MESGNEIEGRRSIEASLTRQQEFTRALLESMSAGVVACDAEGILVLFNRAAREWHGVDIMKLPPEEWAEHYDLYRIDGVTPLPKEDIPLFRAFNGEDVRNAGMAIVAKGQPPRFILANGSMITDPDGRKLGAVVIMRDITELRHAEEDLRRAYEGLEKRVEERTNELLKANEQLIVELEGRRRVENALRLTQFSVDSAADAIMWLRDDGSFFYVNEAACRLLGYSREELLHMCASDLNPSHPKEVWPLHWEELKDKKTLAFEAELRRKDGALVPVEITANYIAFGGLEYNCASVRDITERKLTEDKLARETARNALITELTKYLLEAGSIGEIAAETLRIAQEATESRFGYVGYIDPETGSLVCPTMTYDIWDQCGVEGKRMVFEKFGGLWGWVLNNRKPLMTNDPGTDSRSTGVPAGHIPIRRFLSVPAFYGDVMVGQLALANAERQYKEEDKDMVERIAAIFALGMRRKLAEEELGRLNEELEQRVKERTAELEAKNLELEKFNRLFVGRELRMAELKERISALEEHIREDVK